MIDATILAHLATSDTYGRRVLPFLQEAYFHDRADKVLFNLVKAYIEKYNAFPTKEAMIIDAGNLRGLTEDEFKNVNSKIANLKADPETDVEWLIDKTEKFCQEKAVYNGIMESIKILDDKSKMDKGAIPKILSDALAVSFDTNIGHDFIEDWDKRYELYHRIEYKVPFDIEYFNEVTNGGFSKKTLNLWMAGIGVGKTLLMCHCSAANLMMGSNVLYITMEMAEEEIAKRIDANLLNVRLDEIVHLPKKQYERLINSVQSKTKGKLIVKEYPTAAAGASHFRYLLNELHLKKNFKPDIIYIDYINICASSRIKMGKDVNSYSYVKAIAEELRGLAVEFDVPIVSATQVNREGYKTSDPGMTDVSESFGLPMTLDFMAALVRTEELDSLNQYMIIQLKSRYSDATRLKRFVIGVDRMKMRLFDVEQAAQTLAGDPPVFDQTNVAKFDMNRFKDFR